MHASIHAKTEHLEGYQAVGDSQKLFEMGYYCGDVILEVGVYRGRSAAVSILGALHNDKRLNPPQYFGIDIADEAIVASRVNLKALGLEDYSLLFCGDLRSFSSQVDITPSMVFIDGDHSYQGVKADLEVLSAMLAEGTPVLCHDFVGPEGKSFADYECPEAKSVTADKMWIGVQRACHEWEAAGFAKFAGAFGCSGLYITTDKCEGTRGALRPGRFELFRSALYGFYDQQLLESSTKKGANPFPNIKTLSGR